MSDLISRQAVLDVIFSEPLYKTGMNKRSAEEAVTAIFEKIKALPSVENKGECEIEGEWRTRGGFTYCSLCGFGKLKGEGRSYKFCPCCGKPMIIAYEPRKADMKTETCNGCTHPCVMYEPTMKACEKKGREI